MADPAGPPTGGLQGRALSGARYSLGALSGRQVISLLVVFVLARRLGPDSYGVVSQASLYVAFTALLLDQGLGVALIQRPRLSSVETASALWLNLVVAVVLMALTVALAPAAAGFFRTPELAGVLVALSGTLLLKGAAVVPQALLNRELRFRELAACEVASVGAGAVAAIGAATAGLGASSVVAQTIVADLVLAVACWSRIGGLPLRGSPRALAPLLRFGLNILGGNALHYVMRNLDNVLIGRFLGPAALAFYALSYRAMMLGVHNITRAVNRVALPYYSRLQGEQATLRSSFLRATRLVSLAAFPLMTSVALAAPEAVPLAFGASWAPAVLPMQILAVTGLRQSVTSLLSPVLAATGKPHWELRTNLFTSICLVASFVVGLRGGIVGVASAYTVTGMAVSPLGVLLVCRVLGLTVGAYLRALAPAASGTACLAATWLAVRAGAQVTGAPPLVVLVLAGTSALAVYAALLLVAWPAALADARRLIRPTAPADRGAPERVPR